MTQRVLELGRFSVLVCISFGVLSHRLSFAADGDRSTTSSSDTKSKTTDNSAAHDLRYKFRTGDVLRYDIQHRASIRSTIEELTQSAQTSTDSTKLWKVTDVLPNGEIEFMNVVERVHMINQLPDRATVEYDSERDETPPPGFDDAAKAIGVPLSVVRITPRGEVVERKAKHRQAGTDDDGAAVIRLPNGPVTIGATWDEPLDVKVQLESGGTKAIQTRRHYKLADVANGIATIDVTYQVLSPIDSHIESQLVQRLMSGKVNFDIARGRLVGQQMEVDKRILGFAGPTSSMQYIMRMEEKLIDTPTKTAVSEQASSRARNGGTDKSATAPAKPKTSAKSTSPIARKPTTNERRNSTPKRTSSRSRTPGQSKGSRR